MTPTPTPQPIQSGLQVRAGVLPVARPSPADRSAATPRGQVLRRKGAVSVGKTYQPAKARLAILPHVRPELARFGGVSDRALDFLHLYAPSVCAAVHGLNS